VSTKWQIGDRIQKRWEIHGILKGGMGIVYIVYDHELREPFAAKTFQDELFTRNPAVAERFTREALVWINLDAHQNVTQARMVQVIEAKPFLLLEYVAGGDLGSWIGTPRLTEDLPQVLRFSIQFCDGMTHALARGIKAHRDVKPQNALITQDGILKVTDFGLAKAFDGSDMGGGIPANASGGFGHLFGRRPVEESVQNVDDLRNGLTDRGDSKQFTTSGRGLHATHTGTAAGTPTHMAPEQFDDAKHVDVRADIYSFGVMLFQMITGQLPFVGRTWREFERQHRTQPPPALLTQNSALNSVVETCLSKEPAHRFTDFGAIGVRLAVIYEHLTGEPAPQALAGKELSATEWMNKGVSLTNLGRTEDAVPCYDRALELNPNYAEAWFNKGVALRSLAQFREALVWFEQAERLGLPLAAHGIALCRQQLGR
jgi:serine/threonine protein kinase